MVSKITKPLIFPTLPNNENLKFAVLDRSYKDLSLISLLGHVPQFVPDQSIMNQMLFITRYLARTMVAQ